MRNGKIEVSFFGKNSCRWKRTEGFLGEKGALEVFKVI